MNIDFKHFWIEKSGLNKKRRKSITKQRKLNKYVSFRNLKDHYYKINGEHGRLNKKVNYCG